MLIPAWEHHHVLTICDEQRDMHVHAACPVRRLKLAQAGTPLSVMLRRSRRRLRGRNFLSSMAVRTANTGPKNADTAA